jgi:CheY-like chemotaxis protein
MWRRYGDAAYILMTLAIFGFETIALGALSLSFLLGSATGIASTPVEGILLDLHLPDMPGQEVLRRLQAEPRTAQVPVVILSADARPTLIKDLLAQGVRAFMTKPLDVKELLGLLDDVAGERDQQPVEEVL